MGLEVAVRDGHLHQRMFRRCLGEMLLRLPEDKRAMVLEYWNSIKKDGPEKRKRPAKLGKLEQPLRWVVAFYLPISTIVRVMIVFRDHLHRF
jgi:hypothetical protein